MGSLIQDSAFKKQQQKANRVSQPLPLKGQNWDIQLGQWSSLWWDRQAWRDPPNIPSRTKVGRLVLWLVLSCEGSLPEPYTFLLCHRKL